MGKRILILGSMVKGKCHSDKTGKIQYEGHGSLLWTKLFRNQQLNNAKHFKGISN